MWGAAGWKEAVYCECRADSFFCIHPVEGHSTIDQIWIGAGFPDVISIRVSIHRIHLFWILKEIIIIDQSIIQFLIGFSLNSGSIQKDIWHTKSKGNISRESWENCLKVNVVFFIVNIGNFIQMSPIFLRSLKYGTQTISELCFSLVPHF